MFPVEVSWAMVLKILNVFGLVLMSPRRYCSVLITILTGRALYHVFTSCVKTVQQIVKQSVEAGKCNMPPTPIGAIAAAAKSLASGCPGI